MKKVLGLTLAATLVIASCAKTSSSTGPSTLSSLPKATGAVSDGTAVRNASSLFTATTGVVLKNATTSTFASKSRSFCEASQTVKNLIREASKNDKIACYIGAMEGAGAFTNSYDGSFKYYQLTGAGEGDGQMQIKFKASKDSGGVINNFQMFTCQSNVMQEYLNTTVGGGTASMTAVSSHTDSRDGSDFTGSFRVGVSGSYGTSGWTGTKSVVGQGNFSSTGAMTYSDARYIDMSQGAETVTLQASSSNSFDGHTGTGLVYAIIQGLNMGDVGTFALGDGTLKGTFTHDSGTDNPLVSWNGDTKANLGDATLGGYYATVNAASLPTATTPDSSFTAEETWDCAAEGTFTDIDFEALQSNLSFVADFTACNETYGEDMGNDWIDCPHSGH